MAVRFFLRIDGIEGESTDAEHEGEIEVESFSFGATQAGGFVGGGVGKASFADFSFTTPQSIASPLLFLSCAQGKHLKEAVLTATTVGKAGLDFYKITFTDVVVSSFQESGEAGAEGVTEYVTFNFQRVKVEYRRRNAKGGLDSPVDAGWDIKQSKST